MSDDTINLANHPLIWGDYMPNTDLSIDFTHVFRLSLSDYDKIVSEYPSVLSAGELAKVSRFRKADDVKRYVIGKYFLRLILSSILGLKPADIDFSCSKNKKPDVDGAHFNISHSGQFTTIAISPQPVGVDIEFINQDFDFAPLLNNCFTALELKHIHHITDFYTFWTRKEAILKASGEGLIDNLHDIECIQSIVSRNQVKLNISSNYLDPCHIISLATNTLSVGIKYWDIKFYCR